MVAAAIIGAAGLGLIKTSEGKVNRTYRDPVGIITACYGHTGPELRMGQTFTDDECDALLRKDVAKHQVVVRPGHPQNCVGHVPLNQNQNDAVVSFTFNVGNNAFCKSTMARRLKARDYVGASLEFTKWTKARSSGKIVELPGLIKRRTAEKRLFDSPTYLPASTTPDGPLRGVLGYLR